MDPTDVFIALFAILFGAMEAGSAVSMGPDFGKAQIAATKIFKIIEYPSEINAVEMTEKKLGKTLQPGDVKG